MSSEIIHHNGDNELARSPELIGFGSTEMDAGDVQLPRLRLLQALSSAVTEAKGQAGHFFNTLTETDYGPEITFLPVFRFKNRVRLVVGEGLRCRSLDMVNGQGDPGHQVAVDGGCAICEFKDWPADRRKRGENVDPKLASPECGESINWVGLIVGNAEGVLEDPEMAVVQFRSTAINAAKQLNGLMLQAKITSPNMQWWDRQYKIVAAQQKNDKGTFYVPSVTLAGKPAEALKQSAKTLLSFLAGKALEYEPVDDDEVGGPSAAPQPVQVQAPSSTVAEPAAAAAQKPAPQVTQVTQTVAPPADDEIPF